jgi:hypothetical protein
MFHQLENDLMPIAAGIRPKADLGRERVQTRRIELLNLAQLEGRKSRSRFFGRSLLLRNRTLGRRVGQCLGSSFLPLLGRIGYGGVFLFHQVGVK